jgi:hypothetical protein
MLAGRQTPAASTMSSAIDAGMMHRCDLGEVAVTLHVEGNRIASVARDLTAKHTFVT